jgi:hypothetical protein
MSLIVFAGPSLTAAQRALSPSADWRPPAEAGDILRLDLRPGLTICLIDGYFDHRPAVRHKEILLALASGVRVIGAASIGALRAAEMHRFGMEGVGAIYRAYAGGRISGDDEVALVHAGADRDWRPLSVPLIELRATLCRLMRARRVSAEAARGAMQAARSVHYVDRSWAELEAAGAVAGPLRALLEAEHVPQKTMDACAALRDARRPRLGPAVRPEAVTTSFLRALAKDLGLDPLPRAPDPAT